LKSCGDKIWESIFSSSEWGKYPSEEAVRFFMKNKDNYEAPLKALDLGCGTGAISWFMAKEGAEVSAVDGSMSALNKIGSNASFFGADREIKTVKGDITAPAEFIKGKFNIIIDHYSLCHNRLKDIYRAYRQCFSLLTPGGRFLTCGFGAGTTGIATAGKASGRTFSEINEGPLANRGIISIPEKEDLEKLFSEIGFKIDFEEKIIISRENILIEKIIFCLSR
jgi:SAM-dependent methyltransferase